MNDETYAAYADKMQDLLDEIDAKGGDSVNMMMNWLFGYVVGVSEGEPEIGVAWDFGDGVMVISIEPPDEEIDIEKAARMVH